ncbi:hypothetical protein A8709_31385 [Paenibacillus pectinilyticus]|uniref:Uncharacterized protein n=1 Tax=Paenibacillus pectinilyticus TaxID=512399 RepID=A0A1C0ZW60_9BACL|nr:GerAB/ArcD/ProY family transporter [Paenibacillus pectinilyticus]OCT12335.1 hypothetical protein A8709_31385 [Paenibacillus pectinilyticus]
MQKKLPFFQTTFLAVYAQSGVTAFTLPRILAERMGTNGWAALLICCLVASANLLLISLVYRSSKGKSIFEIAGASIPRIILIPFFTLVVLLWAILGSLVGKEYILIVSTISLQSVPPFVLYLLFEILIFLLISKGILSISYSATLVFFLLLWSYFLLFYTFDEFSLARMTTFLFKEVDHSVYGWIEIYIAFLGYELVLLLFPHVNEKTHVMRAFQIANLITTLTYLAISFIAFGFFSLHQLQHLKYPMLNMLSYLNLPFVRRIDDFLFNLILFRVLLTNAFYGWAAFQTLKWLLPKSKRTPLQITLPYFILAILAAVALFAFPITLEGNETWLNRLGYGEMAVAFFLPILLLICLKLNKNRGENYA